MLPSESLLYASLAGCCALLALRLAREVLVAMEAVVRVAAAVAGIGLAVGASLVFAVVAVVVR
ncbi:hypothetical protein [Paractinoplanes globisporus]|uniref:Uncharacterized protein n=1 Tax=Paractinoplanes globisporus TaxID=113565 RepID=A0ABW6W4Q6_9ACTN|nr:hypothetical protein [Actinoplanes globisporus]